MERCVLALSDSGEAGRAAADAPDNEMDAGEDAPSDGAEDGGRGSALSVLLDIESGEGVEGGAADGWRLAAEVNEATAVSQWVDAETPSRWRVRWTPEAPYGRPMGFRNDPSYETGSILANSLSLHLDFNLAADSSLVDRSPFSRPVEVLGARMVPGIFGGAVEVLGDSHVALPFSQVVSPTGNVTWTLWARMLTGCDGQNRVFVGGEGEGEERSHVWLGVRCDGLCTDQVGGTWKSNKSNAAVSGLCVEAPIRGEWHFVAVVKRGHSPGLLTVYNDEASHASPVSYSEPFQLGESDRLRFGYFEDGGLGYPTDVQIDHAVFFARALSALELRSMHRRGRTFAGFEVRVCEAPASEAGAACADVPWRNLEGSMGPLSNADTGQLETLPFRVDAADEIIGRSAQLRVTLRSDVLDARPVLRDLAFETR